MAEAFARGREDGTLCICSWSRGPDSEAERIDNPKCRLCNPSSSPSAAVSSGSVSTSVPVAASGSPSEGSDSSAPPKRIQHPHEAQNEGDIRLHWDDCEPEGEVVARGVNVHIEQMDDGLWWLRINQPDGPALVGHFRSKRPIRTLWEWE